MVRVVAECGGGRSKEAIGGNLGKGGSLLGGAVGMAAHRVETRSGGARYHCVFSKGLLFPAVSLSPTQNSLATCPCKPGLQCSLDFPCGNLSHVCM